jgi:hypothetical protein
MVARMPLAPGKKNIGKNITELKKAGYPKKQALAIALSTALDKHKPKKR